MTVKHSMRDCSLWKEERKVMWQKIKAAGSVAMERSRLRDVFADYKTTPAILKFLTNTGVGRRQRADEEEARSREEDEIRGWVEEEEGGAEEGEHDE